MPIITREGKGSKLNVQEMDGNLEYLASSSFQNGVYSQSSGVDGEIINVFDTSSISLSPIEDGIEGTYTISNFITGGKGKGASITLYVTSSEPGKLYFVYSKNLIVSGGSAYGEGDILTFSSNDIGGSNNVEMYLTLLKDSVGYTTESSITVKSNTIALSSPTIIMSSLPTSDPGIAGALYIMSQSLKVSLGG